MVVDEVDGIVVERTGLDDDVAGDEVLDEDVIDEEALDEMHGMFRV